MTEENIIGVGKKENLPQYKFADERLTEDELDKVAGGAGILGDLTPKDDPYGGTSGK